MEDDHRLVSIKINIRIKCFSSIQAFESIKPVAQTFMFIFKYEGIKPLVKLMIE